MAVIRADGTVEHDPRCLEGPAAGKVGEISATMNELTALFGQDDFVEDASPGWVIRVEGPDDRPPARVMLNCYKDIRPRAYRNTPFVFSLGALRDQAWAASRVREVITAAREPVPAGTVVVTTFNCEIVLDPRGFYVRCTARDCTWVSEYTTSKSTARRWASDHDEDRAGRQ